MSSYSGNAHFFCYFMKNQSSLIESRLLLLGVEVQWNYSWRPSLDTNSTWSHWGLLGLMKPTRWTSVSKSVFHLPFFLDKAQWSIRLLQLLRKWHRTASLQIFFYGYLVIFGSFSSFNALYNMWICQNSLEKSSSSPQGSIKEAIKQKPYISSKVVIFNVSKELWGLNY